MYVHIVPIKNDSIVYISKSVRKGKSVKRKYIKKLGLLSELDALYGNGKDYASKIAKEMTEQEKEDMPDIILNLSTKKKIDSNKIRLFNAGYLFLQKIYYELALDQTCKNIMQKYKIEYDINKILKDLVFSRIIYPASKLSTYDLANNYLEQPNYKLHDIYRALDVLSKNIDLIQNNVYKKSLNVYKRNTTILYYDCTNFFFEIEEQDGFRNYGVSKEHRPNPIVQMGLFIDGNGIPLAFNINPGNQSEQLSPRPTEEMIEKEFNLTKFIYCSDAGLGSYNNKWFNQLKDRSFIVTQSIKKLKDYLIDWALEDSSWSNNGSIATCNENTILYKSRAIKEKGNVFVEKESLFDDGKVDLINTQVEINQRLIVTYSPKYAAYQKRIREEQISRAKKLINKPSSFDKYSSTDCKRFVKNISFDKNGEVVTDKALSLDDELIASEARFDGFYALVTNLEDNDEEIVKINHNRWKIEESFRIMKTDFLSRPVYLQLQHRIKAHFLTCFLALLIYRIMEQKVNTEEKKYTTTEIINNLRDLNITSLNDLCYTPSFKRTDFSDRLEEVFVLSLSKEGLSNKFINKQIKISKLI